MTFKQIPPPAAHHRFFNELFSSSVYVDDVISRIGRMFPDMSIELFRPNGTSAVLLVTLGKVLKAIVVMRSLFIDRTIVRGYHENVYSEDGKVTDHATTALLHYQLPQMPDVVVRSFMVGIVHCF
uniref:Mediator complex subunit 27 n=2 Tax=Sinocyclocheilus grahami TaxID=75366 RepID=A0A672NKA9_SINGR